MELVSFEQVTDLSSDGDGGLLLRSVERGPDPIEFKTPKAFSRLRLHLKLETATADGWRTTCWDSRTTTEGGAPMELTLEEDHLPFDGVDVALRKGMDGKGMKTGAVAVLSAVAGSVGNGNGLPAYAVPAGVPVTATIELVGFDNLQESWDMNEEQKIRSAGFLKEKGNAAFKVRACVRVFGLARLCTHMSHLCLRAHAQTNMFLSWFSCVA